MINILAVPASEPSLRAFPPSGAQADRSRGVNDWSLVERRMLLPPRKDAITCLVRLERADGEAVDWQAGDSVELVDWPCRADNLPEPSAAFPFGAGHAGVGLLPGGWPLRESRVRKGRDGGRLPIASSVASGVLDLVLVAGHGQDAMLSFAASHALLFDTMAKLRLIGSQRERIPDGPLLFIGDRGAAAFARALLQERPGDELSILIEARHGDGFIRSEAVFSPASRRDGTVGELPPIGPRAIFLRALAARRREIMSLIDRGGRLVIAGASDDFFSIVHRCLGDVLGRDIMEHLHAARRIEKFIGL